MDRQLLVVRNEELRQAVLSAEGPAKAEAAWELYRRLHVDTIERWQHEVYQDLYELFQGQNLSAMEILKVANTAAYRVHMSLVEHGYHYRALAEVVGNEALVERLFRIAQDVKEKLIDHIAAIAQEVETAQELSTETMLYRTLKIWGEFYPASHIVKQYCDSKGLPEPEHLPSRRKGRKRREGNA